jgi:tRNA 2-thiocytidine biosynthesis protein TtcA
VVRRVIPEGRTQCGLCSRLRRGALYRFARERGFTRIALGHHRDDLVETLFLNLFHGGRLKAMPPKLLSDDGTNVVIRPLCYVPEREIARYARARGFPIIPCTLCGSQPNLQREAVQGAAAQAAAKPALRAALGDHAPDHGIRILLDDVVRHAERLEIVGQHALRETGLLLVEVHGGELEAHGGGALQRQEHVEQRVRVLAAGQADHHAVPLPDHPEIGDGLADQAPDAGGEPAGIC